MSTLPAGLMCRWWMAALLAALSACAPMTDTRPSGVAVGSQSDLQSQLSQALRTRPLVLLGEVHDNATQHTLRVRAWQDLLASGARPALLMEQFDRERQPAIDRVLAQSGATADQVITAGQASPGGWDWAFYRPFIDAALAHGVPVIAANVSRADTRRVMADGLAALGFRDDVPSDLLEAHARDIEQSHCGLIKLAQARRMALAQVARDQFMAQQLAQHADRGAVLLAGNGHVRRDSGVVRWLGPDLAARSVTIGLLERGDAGQDRYDVVFITEPAPRPDPCEGMRPATPT